MAAEEVYRRICLMPDIDERVDVGGQTKRCSFRVNRSRRVDPRSRSKWGKKRNASSISILFESFQLVQYIQPTTLWQAPSMSLFQSRWFCVPWKLMLCCADKCDPCPNALSAIHLALSMLTYPIWCYYVLTCIWPLDPCILFSHISSVSVIFYKLVCYIRSAQLEWWTTEEIIFT